MRPEAPPFYKGRHGGKRKASMAYHLVERPFTSLEQGIERYLRDYLMTADLYL